MRLGLVMTAALLTGATSACSNWLSDPEATTNPNQPTEANADQLLVAAQTALTQQYTSDVARTVCVWMQQCAGTDRQYRQLGLYQYGEDAYNGPFSQIYTGGGLLDIRTIQQLAEAAEDQVYGGVGRVMEALAVGFGADIWGDIPYSEAVANTTTPKLDPQQEVYAAIQAKLDTAITLLEGGAGAGPDGADLFYEGDGTKWLHLAHTLKARYYMHVAEQLGNPAYESALAEAQQGLASPDEDLRSYQSADPNEQNSWYQFTVIQRSGYMSPGAFLVTLLRSANDPRLAEYFDPNEEGQYVGAAPGQQGSAAISSFDAVRTGPAFRQPIVTYAENQLIIAEAAFKLGQTGVAQAALTAERQAQGLPSIPATLANIMTEKYIALFQNPEVWNDWKRTCLPALTPAPGNTVIPARLLYAQSERNTNPNIPLPSEQPARNWSDANACS